MGVVFYSIFYFYFTNAEFTRKCINKYNISEITKIIYCINLKLDTRVLYYLKYHKIEIT